MGAMKVDCSVGYIDVGERKTCKKHQHNEKSRQYNDFLTIILNLSPAEIRQHNIVTNITVADDRIGMIKWEKGLNKSVSERVVDVRFS